MSDSSTSNGTGFESAGVKAVITVSVLAAAFVLSVVIARLVDMCYDRRALADDASDISENTRQIIRARLSVIQFRKKEIKSANSKSALDVIRKWANIIKNRQRSRQDVLNSNRLPGHSKDSSSGRDSIIENGIGGDQGGQKTPRNPFFAGAKVNVSPSPRPSTRESRPLSSVRTVSASLHPVQKGQPVISNILLANENIPAKKPPPLILKSVHFNEADSQKSGENTQRTDTDVEIENADS